MKIEIMRLKDGQAVQEQENELNAFIKDNKIIDIMFSEYELANDGTICPDAYFDNDSYHITIVILYEPCNTPASQLKRMSRVRVE